MSAGAINIEKTLITIPSRKNKGNAPVSIAVNKTYTLRAILRDSYSNAIEDERKETVRIELDQTKFKKTEDKSTTAYVLEATDNKNGSWDFALNMYKTGKITTATLFIKIDKAAERNVSWNLLAKVDCPEFIMVEPGKCSGEKTPMIHKDKLVNH